MAFSTLNGAHNQRLQVTMYAGKEVLVADFANANYAESDQLLSQLVECLKAEPESSARVWVKAGCHFDPDKSVRWKRDLPVFERHAHKVALTGMTTLMRIALAGARMYAKLMSSEKQKKATVGIFEADAHVLEFLAAD